MKIKKIFRKINNKLLVFRRMVNKNSIKYLSNYHSPYKLHIGCGGVLKPGWVNIDLHKPADLRLDVRFGLPFPDMSCEIIYTEHFLEHLAWPNESIPFLKECFRVLKNQGVIHIGVPDSKFVVDLCISDFEKFKELVKKYNWLYPDYCQTQYEFINYHFRLGGSHKFAYDCETLSSHLSKVGFDDVTKRGFDKGLDSEHRSFGTLYLMGIKRKTNT